MTPSLQSMDPSIQFSVGVSGTTPTQDQSALLFKKPSRKTPRPTGPNFGKERLRPDGSSLSKGEQREDKGVVCKHLRVWL